MTPQTQAILQDVKNEVLKKYNKEFWTDLHGNVLLLATEDVCQLYHTRLLAEAGRELPDDTKAKKHWNDNLRMGNCTHSEAFFDAYDWMHEEASALLAAKQAEVDELKQAKVALKMMHAAEMKQRMALEAEAERLKGCDNAWPLQDVLTKLVDASDYLLHRKDYDGHGHEELLHCVKRGKEIISQLKPQ